MQPTNKQETQAFLGVVGFWKMHIHGDSQIVKHLYDIIQKKNYFEWGPEQQAAFNYIKEDIVHAMLWFWDLSKVDQSECTLYSIW